MVKMLKFQGLKSIKIRKFYKIIMFIFFFNFGFPLLGDLYRTYEVNVACYTICETLKVLILSLPKSQTLTFLIYIDAGSAQDMEGKSGVAHLVEHMMFFRSSKVDLESQYLKELQEQGCIHMDAQTSPDYTFYFWDIPADKLELLIKFIVECFKNPGMKGLSQEKKIVIEEILLHENPLQKLSDLMLSIAFLRHPYRRPIAGYLTDIENIKSDDILEFVKKYYKFCNMLFVVVGDVEHQKTVNLIEHYFKPLCSPEKCDEKTVQTESLQEGERRIEVDNSPYPLLMIGYHRPGVFHQDDPIFEVMASLLGGYKSSPIYKSIITDKKLTTFITCSPRFHGVREPTLFVIGTSPFSNNFIKEIESIIYRYLEELKNGILPGNELDKAKKHTINCFKEKLNCNSAHFRE